MDAVVYSSVSHLLDPERVKNLRLERAWSQEHLAGLSGLSLRTIQRIEKRGKASMESKKALAAVFEVDLASLAPDPEIVRKRQIDEAALRCVWAGGLIGLILGLVGGMFGLTRILSGSAAWGVAAGLVGIVGLVAGIVFGVKAHKAMRRAAEGDDANEQGDA
jgi:DNA-binding XRE family transcriptional regulator